MITSRRDPHGVGTIVLGLFVLSFPGFSFAGPALEAIQHTHGAVLRALQDPAWSQPDTAAARQQELAQLMGQRFNYRAMARQILGPQWLLLREEERAEFIQLFRLLLLKTYVHYLDPVREGNLQYLDERIDQRQALVRTQLMINPHPLQIEFWLFETEGNWQIYDVAVEGVSLIQSYRSQVKRLLRLSSYAYLVEQLRAKACVNGCEPGGQ
jgi:phospholipid transport system substrate-binding protein